MILNRPLPPELAGSAQMLTDRKRCGRCGGQLYFEPSSDRQRDATFVGVRSCILCGEEEYVERAGPAPAKLPPARRGRPPGKGRSRQGEPEQPNDWPEDDPRYHDALAWWRRQLEVAP